MAVVVASLRDFSRPETMARRYVEWGIGCTPRKLAPDWADPADPLVGCARNGKQLKPDEWDELLADRDSIYFWARPGSEKFLGIGALAAFLIAPIGGALWWTSVLYGLSRVLAPARKPSQPGDESSPTYAFTGLQRNIRGDGVPIPVVYGQHREAGAIVNEYIRSSFDANGNPTSEYLALVLLGEGPIYRIGDKLADGGPFRFEDGTGLQTLEINNQPASNFAGVEAHIRLGSTDQDAIAEFADPVLSFDVDMTLRDSETLTHATTATDVPSSTTAIATAGAFPAGDTNITKWDAEEQYVSGDEADEATVVLEFPQGLISYSTATQAAQSNFTIYQVRYRQVDSGGTPFDDYIVLPARKVELTRAGQLRVEQRITLYDPNTYGAPVIGKYVESRAALQANPGIYTTILGTFVPAAPATLQFSASMWLKRRNVLTPGATNVLFQWLDIAGNEGLSLRLFRQSGGGDTVSFIFRFGTGSALVNLNGTNGVTTQPFGTDVTNWHHIVFTYEASYDGTNTRVRYYIDGVLRGTVTTAQRAVLDATATLRIASDSHTAPTLGYDGHVDETAFWSRALTSYEVASLYNGGAPTATDATANSLIVGGRFDAGTGVSPNLGTVAFGPYASANWILGSGTNLSTDPQISASAGIVRTPESGVKKRGRYLFDVMRLDTEDSANNAVSEVAFKFIQLRTFQQYEYPGMALLAVKIPANDQLSGGAPLITVRVDGRLVPVWDEADPVYPNMVPTYSRNPAWVAVDALTNQEFGLGSVYRPKDLDLPQLQAFADFCDAKVYDNLERRQFVSASYLDSAAEAVTFSAVNLGQDVVRYRVTELPENFPQPTGSATGKYLKPVLTGLTPSPPTWLTNQAAAAAQEIIFVEYRAADTSFYVYTTTTLALGAGQTGYTVSGGQTDTNGLEMHDVRCRFDGVFDRADFDAWDAILQIFATARAAPMRIGSRISVFFDDVSDPVALIGMGSIVPGSWQQGFAGVADRPNAESSDFCDELLNWERTPIADEHPDVTDPGAQSSFRWRRVSVEGITRRGQAKRHLRRDLNAFKLLRRWCQCDLGIDSLPMLPGDVVSISHDVPQYGFSGRIHTTNTTTAVKLDREIVLAPATSYVIQVEDAATGIRETKAVTQAAGTYAAGAAITVAAFSFTPEADDEYALGEVARGESKPFRLVESTFDPKRLVTRCRFIEYDEQVYDDDLGTLPATGASALPVPAAPTIPGGVENMVVSEGTSRGPDGHVRIRAVVTFDHIAETFASVSGADVYVGTGDHTLGIGVAEHYTSLAPDATRVSVDYPFERDETYTLWILPRARNGTGQYVAIAGWVEFTPSGLAPTPRPPANVRGLVAGELAVYQWDDAGDLDQGATVEGRMGGWILGVPIFASPAQARQSIPTAAWAGAAENVYGVATPPLYIRTKTKTGQYSEAVTLELEPAVASDGGSALEISEEDSAWS